MARRPKLFVQVWKRTSSVPTEGPLVFYFTRENSNARWRCFGGPVKTIQRSRVFVDHAPVYGFAAARELAPCGAETGIMAARAKNRFLRRKLIRYIPKPPLFPEGVAVASGEELPVAVAASADSMPGPVFL